jgi:hypothetical protein
MNFLYIPTANPLINTFLRSIVVIAVAVGFNNSWYVAYWYAIIHDAISLSLLYQLP